MPLSFRHAPLLAPLAVLGITAWSPCAHAQWEQSPGAAAIFHSSNEREVVTVEVPAQPSAPRTECQTPCAIDLRPGPLTLHVSREGQWQFDETVTVPPGATSLRVRGPRRGLLGAGVAMMTVGSLVGSLGSGLFVAAVASLSNSSGGGEGLGALMAAIGGGVGLLGGAVGTGMIVGGSLLLRGGRAHLEVDRTPVAFAVTPTAGGAMFSTAVRF